MLRLSDSFRQKLPGDRDEALDVLLNATWHATQSQWEPDGEVYKFGAEAWHRGKEAGKKDAIEFFADKYQLTEKVDIPDPSEEGWEATFEAFFKTMIPAPMNMKELADHIGKSHGTVRTKSSELFPGRKTDSGVS